MAVVMLTDVGRENLPRVRELDRFEGVDLTTWNDIYSAAEVLLDECVGHVRGAGWTSVGKKEGIDHPSTGEVMVPLTFFVRKHQDLVIVSAYSFGPPGQT